MAQTDHKLELLKAVPLFAGLSRHDLEQIEQLAEEVDVPDGQVLTRTGAPGSEFFVIVDGTVRVEAGDTTRTLGGGDFLGEIALIDDGPRTATATTVGPAKLMVLGRREFRSLMSSYPTIENAVLRCLVERVARHDPSFTH
jgi:CRP/FNR family transcriptional regulator, cyclic AMP receptor protein